jgi:hypothetical protein
MSGVNSLRELIIILPEAKMDYTSNQITKFTELWNEGITIGAIAEYFGVAIYEMALLVIHCELEGLIQPREGGLIGTIPRRRRI